LEFALGAPVVNANAMMVEGSSMATSPMLQFRGTTYAAFLFDMDGTLLDSSAVVERTWRQWANQHGVDPVQLLSAVHGVRAEDTVRRFAPAGVDVAVEVSKLLQTELADVEGVEPILGVQAFLQALASDAWAVVTSAPRALAEVRLLAAHIPVPRVLVGAEDVERGKPDPEGYLRAAEALCVPISECLVFEDSLAGVEAAKSAGAHVAIVGGSVPASHGMWSLSNYL
jgi:mannitol-1-/sugar-/sorbitol-6-phosphatase